MPSPSAQPVVCNGIMDESPRVLSVISTLLERVIQANDTCEALQLQQCGANNEPDPHNQFAVASRRRLTVFHGTKAPAISVEKYVERIFKYANCSPSCFVVAYAYLDRFLQQQPGVPITSLNVHRLLITSVMVAAKFLDDVYYNNATYAKVGGVAAYEMNRLELEFLFRLGFRLHVTVGAFDNYCRYLEMEVQQMRSPVAVPAVYARPHASIIHSNCGLGTNCVHSQHHHHQDVS